MKILVIGGMHGNEMLGVELVRSLADSPIENVDYVLANEKAIAAQQRFVRQDLNRSFPGIATDAKFYEQRRPVELLNLCKKYDVVFDFHNTYCPDNDCVFVGENSKVFLLGISKAINLPRVILADYDCINKYAPNCMSIEISVQSELNSVAIWREELKKLSEKDVSEFRDATGVAKFRFVYRMTLEDKKKFQLNQMNLRAFQPIDPSLASKMDVSSPAYPIFINDKFTPYNYGGLLTELSSAQ